MTGSDLVSDSCQNTSHVTRFLMFNNNMLLMINNQTYIWIDCRFDNFTHFKATGRFQVELKSGFYRMYHRLFPLDMTNLYNHIRN